jgi:hypothetical protein
MGTTYCTDRFTRLDYGQFLVSSVLNFSLTYFADHAQRWSHDTIRRYLKGEKITPRILWEKVKDDLVPSENGCIVFDDTVIDKQHSRKMGLVRRQWSGNAGGVIRGIGVVTCIYVNPETGQFWVIDYRIYDPDGDGKTKITHLSEMLTRACSERRVPFKSVLMDTWYASKDVMRLVERLKKVYYCPLRCNRHVDETGGAEPHRRVDELTWTEEEEQYGKQVHVKKFPKGHRVKLFRLVVSSDRTDYVVTNDPGASSTQDAQKACARRWKIEQFHRELKQVTGIERCQCRGARMQRNHIGCAMLVWVRLKQVAQEVGQTIYQVKHGQLRDYMIQQLKAPSVRFA